MRDPGEIVRRETVYALGKVRNSNAVTPLIQTFRREKSAEVKNACVVALGEIGDVSAVEFLNSILEKRPKNDDDADEFMRQWQDIARELGVLFTAGTAIDAPQTQELIDRHYRWILLSWTPNRESYKGLGDLYVDSDEFRVNFEVNGDNMAEWVRDAMAHYAETRL